MTTRATAVLAPLMDIPFHGITLMQSPPMLYSTAAAKDAQDASLLCGHDTAPFSVSLHISRPPELILRSLPRCSRPLRRRNTQRGSGSLKNAPCPEGQRA